jgi:hypothetical protein
VSRFLGAWANDGSSAAGEAGPLQRLVRFVALIRASGMLTRKSEDDAVRILTQATSPGAHQTHRDANNRNSQSGLPACFICGAREAY